jgi:uncharacterized membrane protein (TIGR01666 family)
MMDYRTQYRSFINSYYLSEGVRITAGLTLPTVIGTFFHHEEIGITLSIGAICVTIVDNAGPVVHRKNAMLVCNAVIFIASLLTGLAVRSPWLTGILVAVFCFMFSMIGVYGPRAGSIGLAGLFVMVLNLTHQSSSTQAILLNAVFILCGGIWYMGLSLSLYSFRPYKVTKQALGDLIQSIGEYMLWRTAFYAKNPNYDTIYSRLLEKQAEINDKQNLVRELLYKSRDFVKESTNTGRITLLIFIDINDLFERVMSLQLHHKIFHEYFDSSDILGEFKKFLLLISDELNQTGIVLKSGRAYPMNDDLSDALTALKKKFEDFRRTEITAANVEGFIGLRALIDACEDFTSRIKTIQQYTAYDLKNTRQDKRIQNYDQFVTHQDIDAKIFLENFNWKSNTFRHAIRVSLATTFGFIISQFFPFGHSYWILLTIIVILKPAYSITKSRNRDRLLGTLAGAAIGIVILFLVRDKQLLIVFMIVLMILAYTFMRTRYLIFTTLMTPYILILLYILNPVHFRSLIFDRVIDTAIGSGIALLANILFSPEWAYKQFGDYLEQMLQANKKYFFDVTSFFTGQPVDVNQYKLSRKNAFVALANISDALNRMISEPKSKQKNAAVYHELVVLNYMMATHIATLATFALGKKPPVPDTEYIPVVQTVISNLDQAMDGLKTRTDKTSPLEITGQAGEVPIKSDIPPVTQPGSQPELSRINDRLDEMVSFRKKELKQGITESRGPRNLSVVKSINDQFNFIWKISEDLLKTLRA